MPADHTYLPADLTTFGRPAHCPRLACYGLALRHRYCILTPRGGRKMRVYMDNCCFNRPFDDQTQTRVRLETEAKLEI